MSIKITLICLTSLLLVQGQLENGALYKIVGFNGHVFQAQPIPDEEYLGPVHLVQESETINLSERWTATKKTAEFYTNPWQLDSEQNNYNRVSKYIIAGPCCQPASQHWNLTQSVHYPNKLNLEYISYRRDNLYSGLCLKHDGNASISIKSCDDNDETQNFEFVRVE